MSSLVDASVAVIVPNWNGADKLAECLDSLQDQSLKAQIIVVDNGSLDDSVDLVESKYSYVKLIKHAQNLGFAGGVNAGFRMAMGLGATYVGTLNNDARADKDWLARLVTCLEENPSDGIATCKLLTADGKSLDSTGDYYTNWGLPYPRGRNENDINKYDGETDIFAASGGASVYRVKMLEEVGLFDEDFFAYYEDVDLSFRAQLAGWKITYVPEALAYHQIGATSSKIKGFTTYHTLKNLPVLLLKNVPRKYLWSVSWRYKLVQFLFVMRAISRGQIGPVIRGKARCVWLLPSTLRKRRQIQHSKSVSDEYIWNFMVHDLPPNALALRRIRSAWWRLTGKRRAS